MLRFGVENDMTQSIMVKWLEDLCSKNQNKRLSKILLVVLMICSVGTVEFVPPSEMNDYHLGDKKGIIVGTLPVDPVSVIKIDEQNGSFALIPLHIKNKQLGAVLLLSSDPANA
jgi:hypothetical protein